jgi:CubicO group peptidase (beta-lactamase class C family)
VDLEKRFDRAKKLAELGQKELKLYPACALLMGDYFGNYYEEYIGCEKGSLFDIASLTKPIAGIAILFHTRTSLDEKIYDFLGEPKSDKDEKAKIKVKDILFHKAGFCAHIPLFEKVEEKYRRENIGKRNIERKNLEFHAREIIFDEAWNLPLCYKVGEKCVYSDIGFICLTRFFERKTQKNILELFSDVKLSLKANRIYFYNYAPENEKKYIVKTSHDLRVHDENSYYMNSLSLHAGLLSDAYELSKFCVYFIENIDFSEGEEIVKKGERFFLGFDSFILEDKILFGHLGFTGCGFWIEHKRKEFCIFLSNRVFPSYGRYPSQAPKEFLELRKKIWMIFGGNESD